MKQKILRFKFLNDLFWGYINLFWKDSSVVICADLKRVLKALILIWQTLQIAFNQTEQLVLCIYSQSRKVIIGVIKKVA